MLGNHNMDIIPNFINESIDIKIGVITQKRKLEMAFDLEFESTIVLLVEEN